MTTQPPVDLDAILAEVRARVRKKRESGATDRSDHHYDYHQKALNFRVVGSSREVGIARLPHRWEVE